MNAPDSSGPDERFDEASPPDDDATPLLDLFDATAPPDPGPAAWAGVFDSLAAEFPPVPVRRPWWPAAAASVGLVAAGLLGALGVGPNRVTAPPAAEVARQPIDDPLAGLAVLPVAGADEVEVRAVRGTQPVALVVGDSPVPAALPLAAADEVWVRSGAAVNGGPADRPMLVLPTK